MKLTKNDKKIMCELIGIFVSDYECPVMCEDCEESMRRVMKDNELLIDSLALMGSLLEEWVKDPYQLLNSAGANKERLQAMRDVCLEKIKELKKPPKSNHD